MCNNMEMLSVVSAVTVLVRRPVTSDDYEVRG